MIDMRWTITLFLLFAVPAQAQTADQLVRQFEAVAFSNEFSGTEHGLRRMAEAPRLRLMGQPGYFKRFNADIVATATRASELTGMMWRPGPNDATYTIAMARRDQFATVLGTNDASLRRHFGDSVCVGVYQFNGTPDVIDTAVVVIDIERRDELVRHCIAEEMVQVLGLPNDACHYRPSLFCEADMEPAMTAADEVLLRTLYNPRLEPGMSKAEAMPIVREIIAELWNF